MEFFKEGKLNSTMSSIASVPDRVVVADCDNHDISLEEPSRGLCEELIGPGVCRSHRLPVFNPGLSGLQFLVIFLHCSDFWVGRTKDEISDQEPEDLMMYTA